MGISCLLYVQCAQVFTQLFSLFLHKQFSMIFSLLVGNLNIRRLFGNLSFEYTSILSSVFDVNALLYSSMLNIEQKSVMLSTDNMLLKIN